MHPKQVTGHGGGLPVCLPSLLFVPDIVPVPSAPAHLPPSMAATRQPQSPTGTRSSRAWDKASSHPEEAAHLVLGDISAFSGLHSRKTRGRGGGTTNTTSVKGEEGAAAPEGPATTWRPVAPHCAATWRPPPRTAAGRSPGEAASLHGHTPTLQTKKYPKKLIFVIPPLPGIRRGEGWRGLCCLDMLVHTDRFPHPHSAPEDSGNLTAQGQKADNVR